MAPVEVFFSYSHRDEKLRDKLAPHLSMLQREGVISAWHDRKIGAGTEWAKAIDDNLNAAGIILLLISADFLASDYCYDIEMQRAIARHEAGAARVIPIILKPVDWSSAPFSKLQAFPKDAKPVTTWSNRDAAFVDIAKGIRGAAEAMAAAVHDRSPATSILEEPLPTAALPPLVELEEGGGQVPLDSPFYMERPPIETRCYEVIVKPGALIRIKAPRQMGKSSLTIRLFDHAGKQGYQAVWLQLQQAGEQAFASLDSFLQWLCRRVTAKLRLQDKVAESWQSVSASTDKCTDYFELYLLEAINAPLVLCLDEVDEIFKHPEIASDFFGLLRSWHEESKINPVWRNLRLVITHSEEVYIPLNINQSPFNVGVPIELPPLNRAQLGDLVKRHGLAWSEAEVEALMAMVGGQPFLARVALQQIASETLTLSQFLQVAPTQAGLFASHLRRHLGNLQERHLETAMKQVASSEQAVQLPISEASKLANMGLVTFQVNEVVPMCNLYRQYFRDVLGGSR